jgi:hypothetical protein
MIVVKSGLLGLCAVWMGNFFWTFRRNVNSLRRQAYESTDGQTTLKTKAVRAFETSGSNHSFQHCATSRYNSCTVPVTQVTCYYGRSTCTLTADFALLQTNYTTCIQHKAILLGGWVREGGGMRIVSLFE